jgi:hypothetical protein
VLRRPLSRPPLLIFDTGIAGLRRLPPFDLGWVRCLGRVATWWRM